VGERLDSIRTFPADNRPRTKGNHGPANLAQRAPVRPMV